MGLPIGRAVQRKDATVRLEELYALNEHDGARYTADLARTLLGTQTIDGVWFQSYSHDHKPPHVHGTYGGVRVIVDLLPDGTVQKAKRWNVVTPRNGKRSSAAHVLNVAAANVEALRALWENTHGTSFK